ncbi:uncharacterized protein YutE (UPF0331/DUF86 family) [Marinimicrobium koreense]|uniref:Uncharacterized protein YutE (UPF0331/DUF86 family) n=1 Tax=Marinimicrobium koreense TaxID=306545 RepID=A0A3N1NPS4_9GAMM|nr:DUF86 domain-containing protein [Marinimicrobium koreense]ROQ20862.1 uncharacterized protein YutE (UPF0331/DUF86 family) [Marinimicrobium koreense]
MQLDLYLQETARLAERQGRLLNQAAQRVRSGETLTELEQNGVLHAIQVLTENAIGKAKHLLKTKGHQVPVSAYDAFRALSEAEVISKEDLTSWNAIVGLRNRIVHDYLNIDFHIIETLLVESHHQIIVDFLTRKEEIR